MPEARPRRPTSACSRARSESVELSVAIAEAARGAAAHRRERGDDGRLAEAEPRGLGLVDPERPALSVSHRVHHPGEAVEVGSALIEARERVTDERVVELHRPPFDAEDDDEVRIGIGRDQAEAAEERASVDDDGDRTARRSAGVALERAREDAGEAALSPSVGADTTTSPGDARARPRPSRRRSIPRSRRAPGRRSRWRRSRRRRSRRVEGGDDAIRFERLQPSWPARARAPALFSADFGESAPATARSRSSCSKSRSATRAASLT